jgi:hypothetical protein
MQNSDIIIRNFDRNAFEFIGSVRDTGDERDSYNTSVRAPGGSAKANRHGTIID